MPAIYENLYQFSSYIPPIDLSFHQYLLMGEEPLLIHTGSLQMAEAMLPKLKEVLGEKKLKYIFVSHFESDECGGLAYVLKHYPEAVTLCSAQTAGQLKGFGIMENAEVKNPGEQLNIGDYQLEFINYPSEMHLWAGLLLMENKKGIFFSSDLIFQFGKAEGSVIDGDWEKEVNSISHFQVPDPEGREKLQQELMKLKPKFVAAGHGPCRRL